MGMRQYPLDPNHEVLGKILNGDEAFDFVSDTINQGFSIMAYEAAQGKNYMNLYSFDAAWEVEGKVFKVLVVNRQAVNPIFFESVFDESKHDIMMSYAYNGSKTKYTMFSPYKGTDVGKLAKLMGGGGHRNAAGFEIEGEESLFG
jgi:nanoRNase/pAp phosphatase (c-di-AMP/oligoRNAs hydrolase)